MKLKTKNKIKKGIDQVAKDFTKTNPTLAITSFIMLNFFLFLFLFGFTGIRDGLFNDYFEMLVILFLGYITLSLSNFHILHNGYLGLANGVYLFLGVVSIIAKAPDLILTGGIIIRLIWMITLISFIYVYINQNWEGWKQWLNLRSQKQ